MLLVIFGAGASYDSDATYPPGTTWLDVAEDHPNRLGIEKRPPLAKDLFGARFGEIASWYPECSGLFPHLRTAPDIEEYLETLSTSTSDPGVHAELLALRYYIRAVIRKVEDEWDKFTFGVTNYADLLRHLRAWKSTSADDVALATFNYDLMLDIACGGVLRKKLDTVADYVADRNWAVFKLHGSISWLRQACNLSRNPLEMHMESGADPADVAYNVGLDSADHLVWSNEYATVSEIERGDKPRLGDYSAYLPAIAVPQRTKAHFECPEDHLVLLSELLGETTRLLVSGWKAGEAHFLQLCKEHRLDCGQLKSACIVAGSEVEARAVWETLEEAGFSAKEVRFVAGFSNLIRSGQLGALLA